MSHFLPSYSKYLKNSPRLVKQWLGSYWQHSWWHKFLFILSIFVLLCLGTMYGIARWYIATNSSKPFVLGTSFIPAYAQSLGVDPKATLNATLNDLHVKHLRLVSYWDQLEPTPGQYDFSSLDWQFRDAEAAHADVTLSIGLRQPRWPECHMPSWAASEPTTVWEPQLNNFIVAVIDHYKTSPSLVSYQLENEYFLSAFGTCTNYDKQRLINEANLVRATDPRHTLIISRSNNGIGWSVHAPQPDEYGISLYRRVWDVQVTHRYFQHPEPAWYYAFVAGMQKILTGKDTIIHEMQAEPWTPNGKSIPETSLTEQNKSFNASDLKNRVEYGRATGMPAEYLWGSEYWYYRMVVLHDPSVWNAARQAFSTYQ